MKLYKETLIFYKATKNPGRLFGSDLRLRDKPGFMLRN